MNVSTYERLVNSIDSEDVATVSEILKDAVYIRGIIYLAYSSSNPEIVSILLDYIIDGETPYYVVWCAFVYYFHKTEDGEIDYTKAMLLDILKSKGVDFNALDDKGQTILFDNVYDKSTSELIIAYGVDPTHKSSSGQTAYEYSISVIEKQIELQLEIVRLRREGNSYEQTYEQMREMVSPNIIENMYKYEDPREFYKSILSHYVECLDTIRPTMTKRALSVRDKTY
jgi:hypothetical protein